MKPKKTLHLTNRSDEYELVLSWLDENQISLAASLSSGDEPQELGILEATVSQVGSEIRIQTANGTLTGHAAQNSTGLWISLGDQTAFFEQAKRDSGAGTSEIAETDIVAPMTGKIVEVRVKPSQKVAEGEILVIMEAMKMEFKLEASMNAVIEQINCEVDELVDLGQILVKLAPTSDES